MEDSLVDSMASNPLVLHACWSAGSIHVWAESSVEDFAKAEDLQAALIAAGFPEDSLSGTTVLQLELPKISGQHNIHLLSVWPMMFAGGWMLLIFPPN